MSKMNGMTGGAAAMPRPMPNPRLNPAPAAPAAPAGGGGLVANMPIQKRFDMAMDLLKNGMSMAADSGSPLAQFLAPLAGAVIGGGIENKRAKLAGAEGDELFAAMMPGAANQDEIKRLGEIVSNPDTPDYLKSIAKAKLDAAIAPYMPQKASKGGGGGKKSGGGGTGTGKSKQKLYGEYEIDGVLHGRNATGEMIPYVDSKGNPVKTGKKADLPAVPDGAIEIDGYQIEAID